MRISGSVDVPKELGVGSDVTEKKKFMIDYCTNLINKHDLLIGESDIKLTLSLNAKETPTI